MQLLKLPYRADTAQLFAPIAQEPWAVYLDSSFPIETRGRYDILSCAPYIRLYFDGKICHVQENQQHYHIEAKPWDLLRQYLATDDSLASDLPFQGGAIGYWGYDLNRLELKLNSQKQDNQLPVFAVGIYDWALVVDHLKKESYLVSQGRAENAASQWQQRVEQFSEPPASINARAFKVGRLQQTCTEADYHTAFAKIQAYIRAGDCYQVNFAQRFFAQTQGHAWALYQHLRHINPAPFAAYMNLPQGQILSSSPEQFIQNQGGEVRTCPIKGTRPQLSDPIADLAEQQALRQSAKDRAENIMIVDLMRNDLGKVCATGSIAVPELCQLHSFATVHHLISTVTGRLAQGQDSISLLASCFPGGSITGAPKRRAMEIIAELEPHQRGLYCGSIGYISYDGQMDTNIAIRSLVHDQSTQTLSFWAGGGIVADSKVEAEYQESFDKAAALIKSLKAFQ